MFRSRVVLNLLAARQAARQSGEQSRATSQPSTRIRNRPALQTSSSPKVLSQPSLRQEKPTAAPRLLTSGAQSVVDRLQARRERLATAAAPSSDKASIPGKSETRTTVRQRRDTRPSGGASSEKQAPRHLIVHRARQLPPVVEKLNKPARQAIPVRSVAGSSLSYVAPKMVAQATSPPCPLTPQAPRAARFRNVNCQSVPFSIPVKSPKVPLRGILKRDGEHRRAARRGLRWAEELQSVKVVDRWIGVSCETETPEKVTNKFDHVHPDPTRYIGKLLGWTGPDGQDNYITGTSRTHQHAECRSPECNKRSMHQYYGRRDYYYQVSKVPLDLPRGQQRKEFNEERGFTYSKSRTGGRRLPKDIGLDIWMEAAK
ncbi:MAG: hypothetical protein Q9172_004775 [Xanthocarpia lactea]